MRRVALSIGGILLALMLCSFMPAAHGLAIASHGVAVGRGSDSAGEQFTFSAAGGPSHASGFASITFPPSSGYPNGFTVKGTVSCYEPLSSNSALFAVQIGRGSTLPANHSQNRGFTFSVHANPDYMGTGCDSEVVTDCTNLRQGGNTAITQGKIIINNNAVK